ncbi:hypothetical protein BOSEA31B_14604 [Hyphomicrobiales bacterium]|nr:hypothetical protein BOSEA31B_14604 [Hyphomicrobiales bacterium]CAI0344158.1 hypothetical protein BO1005MUT1_310187 [Hyphomicrobiales bacterium]
MLALAVRIHELNTATIDEEKAWMAGTSPAMTGRFLRKVASAPRLSMRWATPEKATP